MAGRVLAEELGAVLLQGEVHDALAELVGPDLRARQLRPGEERRELGLVDRVAVLLPDGAERDEVEPAGLLDELADGVRVGDAGQLDDDPIGALGRDERLGDPGRIDPALHDLADDLEVFRWWGLVPNGEGLVFDAEAALEVQAQLRLDGPIRARGRVGQGEPGDEVDDEGDDPDDEDQQRPGSAHQRRMIQDSPDPEPPAEFLARSSGRPRARILVRRA